MQKIVVSRKIPQKFIKQLEDIGEVEVWDASLTPMPREKFLTALKDATACFVTLSEIMDEEVIEAAPNLKVIANMAVGYDNIDIDLMQSKGIVVTNTPGVLTETTAELGFTLMLAVARRVVEAETYVQNGEWQSWGPYLFAGKDLYQANVGIYGMGGYWKSIRETPKRFQYEYNVS